MGLILAFFRIGSMFPITILPFPRESFPALYFGWVISGISKGPPPGEGQGPKEFLRMVRRNHVLRDVSGVKAAIFPHFLP